MPYDDPDPTDPMTLHGVAVDVGDDSAMRDMAECFVEEYARLGFSADRLMRVFQNPGFAGPHLAYATFGEKWIAELIAEQLSLRPPRDCPDESLVVTQAAGVVGLRVLES